MARPRLKVVSNPWMTVTLGIRKTPKAYLRAMDSKENVCILKSAAKLLEGISISQTRRKLNLVIVEIHAGQWSSFCWHDAITLAQKSGLELCPAEVGPVLRLALSKRADRPWGENLLIGMDTLCHRSGGNQSWVVFSIKQYDPIGDMVGYPSFMIEGVGHEVGVYKIVMVNPN